MDFIFGTFATDELKLIHHRTARHGVQHGFAHSPRDPAPGDPVILFVQIGTDCSADRVACIYTVDGSIPAGSRGKATNGQAILLQRTSTLWDAAAWGYVTTWQGTLPSQRAGVTVRYRISAWLEESDSPEVWADWPVVRDVAEQAAAAFFRGDPLPESLPTEASTGRVFSYPVDILRPPDWAREAVIYQVFVDRFYPGHGRDWLQKDRLSGFCGGTLWGVRDKLDYIADLGVTCIWLSPVWASPSHHGYDVTDYTQVEPRLGGNEALAALIEDAHARGLRVLLDMVCNHVSDQHPFFQAALLDPASPYREWFHFTDSADNYRGFFGVTTMPEINVDHPAARAWLLDTAQSWLRDFGADGYRLDYANGPGPGFWAEFRAACRAVRPDAFCFGEIVDQPLEWLSYIGRLDGCLDFHTGEMLRHTYGYGVRSQDDLARFLERHDAYFADQGDFIRPTFIDNHDMDRFLFIARGDKDALRRAAAAQMQLPGPPIIYYGTEVGLSQRHSKEDGWGLEVSREPMLWDAEQDRDLLAFYRALISERRARF